MPAPAQQTLPVKWTDQAVEYRFFHGGRTGSTGNPFVAPESPLQDELVGLQRFGRPLGRRQSLLLRPRFRAFRTAKGTSALARGTDTSVAEGFQ